MTVHSRKLTMRSPAKKELGYSPRVGNWHYDVVNNIGTWSDAILDILGLPLDTKPDSTLAFKFYREPYLGILKKAIARAYQSGTSWDLELELVTANGNVIWIRSYGRVITENDTVLAIKGILMDINEYRTNESSFNLLKQRHKQLNGFTHLLTHNLRNYSNNIYMLASMIDRNKLDANNADLLDKINIVSTELKTTIEQMAEIIRVNENKIESESIKFEDALEKVQSVMSVELNQNEVAIKANFLVPFIFFPNLYLDSILLNLVSNSIKYRKDTEKPKILISSYVDEDKDWIIMEYQDNGIGIDLNRYGDKVFGLYERFSDRPGGHGVGLFLVKTQIESQGGFIDVESKPDLGTVFRIFFKPGAG